MAGGTIKDGSSKVFADGKPVARATDPLNETDPVASSSSGAAGAAAAAMAAAGAVAADLQALLDEGAAALSILDIGNLLTATNIEDALAELAGAEVPLEKMADLAAYSIMGNATGSAATPAALTVAQIKQLLGVTVQTASDANATITPTGTDEVIIIAALSVAITSVVNPGGTVWEGKKLMFRIKDDGTPRAISGWGSQYRGTAIALPSITTTGKSLYAGFSFNAVDSKWDLIALQEI